MAKILIRSLIIFLWIALISLILYSPKWEFVHEGRTINIFTWGDILEPNVIADFEKETGIKVNVNFYASNEELLAKLKATRGFGYDLIIPSDYAVHSLAEEGLLKELDKSKLDFWQHLNPLLLGHTYDPENRYALPFSWELYGLGIDKTYFSLPWEAPSWRLVFDKEIINYKIAMINDPIEAITLAAFYLFGPVEQVDDAELNKVKTLLSQQRGWVEAYASFRGDYFLATKTCPVIVASSSYIWRTKRLFSFVGFAIPKEGTYITIENLCIPAHTDKEDLVYQLINYLYRPQSVSTHFRTYGFFPATTYSASLLDLDEEAKKLFLADKKTFSKFHFFKNIASEQKMRDLWVEVKSGADEAIK